VEKHPLIFQDADLVVINKVDLAEAVGASVEKMVNDVKELNPGVKVITSSIKMGKGLDEIISTIESYVL
jgi:hydrogenase nickel incorporation protein HypB